MIPFGLLGQAGLSALLHVLKDTRLVRGIVESIKVHFILATVQELQDQFDSSALYRLIEDEIVPAYFERDKSGTPPRCPAIACAWSITK